MKNVRKISALLAVFMVFVVSSPVMAQPSSGITEEKDLPKRGSLSKSITDVHDSRAVDGPWGGLDAQGGAAAPISGSVSRINQTLWRMKVFNNSDDTYSIDVAVNQFNKQGTKTKSDSFSYTLKPRQSAERDINAPAHTDQASLDLVSWKKLTPPAVK